MKTSWWIGIGLAAAAVALLMIGNARGAMGARVIAGEDPAAVSATPDDGPGTETSKVQDPERPRRQAGVRQNVRRRDGSGIQNPPRTGARQGRGLAPRGAGERSARARMPGRVAGGRTAAPAIGPVARSLRVQAQRMRRLGHEDAARYLDGVSRDLLEKAGAWGKEQAAERRKGQARAQAPRVRSETPQRPRREAQASAPARNRAQAKVQRGREGGSEGGIQAKAPRIAPLPGAARRGSTAEETLRSRMRKMEQELQQLRRRLRTPEGGDRDEPTRPPQQRRRVQGRNVKSI